MGSIFFFDAAQLIKAETAPCPEYRSRASWSRGVPCRPPWHWPTPPPSQLRGR